MRFSLATIPLLNDHRQINRQDIRKSFDDLALHPGGFFAGTNVSDEHVKRWRLFQHALWKNDEEVWPHLSPLHHPQTDDVRLDRHALHIEFQLITQPNLQLP